MSTPPKKVNNQNIELKRKLKELEDRLGVVEARNKQLEYRVTKLESSNIVLSKVNSELSREVDRLDQYHRRSNVIIKNMVLPKDDEPSKSLNKKVLHILNKDLEVNETVINDVDKMHRVGKVKHNKNGRQTQDVIIRFKTHSSRYAVMEKRKLAKNIKISPNLTPKRGKLWYDASNRIAPLPEIDFVFADIHGDLNIRLTKEFKNKFVHGFSTIEELEKLILDMGLSFSGC